MDSFQGRKPLAIIGRPFGAADTEWPGILMSYRAFKRLLGETSLERKCRWLLGAGVLLLMTAAFWVYARQTEDLAYEQLETTGRALLSPIVAKYHVKGEQFLAVDEFQKLNEQHWPATLKGYSTRLIKPDSKDPGYLASSHAP